MSVYLVQTFKKSMISGPSDMEAYVSETINLPCSVVFDSSSDLEVVWKKDNVYIDLKNERIIPPPF